MNTKGGQVAKPKVAIVALAVLISGCAHVPDVKLSYYKTKWNAIAAVTQTVGCTTDKTQLIALPVPSVTTSYSADRASDALKLDIKGLDGPFADSDFTMGFTDDGRLKSINQSSTGQGENIIKSAVGLATAVGGIAKFTMSSAQPIAECDIVEKWGGKGPVTLVYRTAIDSGKLGSTAPLEAAPESKRLYDLLKGQLPPLSVAIGKIVDTVSGPSYDASRTSDAVLLELQKMATVEIIVRDTGNTIAAVNILVPQASTYKLPIPKAEFFGKQSFTLALSEAGAVTSVGYGKNVGAAGAINALASVVGMDTAAAKAADMKAQADLIAQQQRLVLCETKPDQCK